MDLITSYQLLFQHQGSGCDRKQANFVLTNKMLADSMLIYSPPKNIALIFLRQFKALNNEKAYREREEVKLCGSITTDTHPSGTSVARFPHRHLAVPSREMPSASCWAQLFLTSRPRRRG